MKENSQDVTNDIQRMYELSLAIGNTLNPTEICEDFSRTLMRLVNLKRIDIWLYEKSSYDTELFYSFPKALDSHYPKIVNHDPFAHNFYSKGKLFAEGEDQSNTEEYASIKLGNIGYVRIIREGEFDDKELRQMRPVVRKLSFTLEGAISHTSLEKANYRISLSEERFRSYFEQGNIGMVLTNPKGDRLKVNQRYCQMLGYTEKQMLAFSWEDNVHPDDLESCRKTFSSLYSEQQSKVRREVKFLTSHQEVLYTEASIQAVYDPLGNVDHYISLLVDISDIKKANAKLKLADSVYKHASEGILVTDQKGIILDVNEAFVELTGYEPYEVLGKTPRILKSGLQSESFYKEMWSQLMESGYWRGEVWNRKKSGELFAELLSIASVKDENGKISRFVSVFSDITRLKNHQEELERMAHYDALTQLPNRILLSERLLAAITLSDMTMTKMAVIYLDLDNFKPVNDQYGHEVGDHLLIEASSRMKRSLNTQSSVGRLGGDEFVIVLSDISSHRECEEFAANMIKKLSEPFEIAGNQLSISASMGITIYPEDLSDADGLIRNADQAMYKAKKTGKNCYHFYDPNLDKRDKQVREANVELNKAIVKNELALFYQPKVNVKTGRVVGCEALIRWYHPDLKLLMPGDFLPLIDSKSLQAAVGDWVISEALKQMQSWKDKGIDLSVSVNIAASHLQKKGFTDTLSSQLSNYPAISPSQFEIEILETEAFGSLKTAKRILESCRELGIQIAIDDFGTGYSSLTYLRNIPANTLKIDRSFVIDMLIDEEDRRLVEGIIGLSKAFKKNVVAEGVETEEHCKMLLSMGCEVIQGVAIAEPMPAEEFESWYTSFQPASMLTNGTS